MKAYAICMSCLTVIESERQGGWGNVPNHYCVECGAMNFKSLRDYLKERDTSIEQLTKLVEKHAQWIATIVEIEHKLTTTGPIT